MEPSPVLSLVAPHKDVLYSLFFVMPESQLKVVASVNKHFAQSVASFRYDYTLRPLLRLKSFLKRSPVSYSSYPPTSMAQVDRAICNLKSKLLQALLLKENSGLRLALADSSSAVLRNLAIGAEFVVQYPCGSSLETTKLQVIGLLRFRQFPYLETIDLIFSRRNYFFGTPRRCRKLLLTVMVNYAHSGKISMALQILKKIHTDTVIPLIYVKVVSKAYLLRSQYDDVIALIRSEVEPQRRKELNDFVVRMLMQQGQSERAHFFRNQMTYTTGGTVQKPFSKMGPALPMGNVPLK